MLKLFGWLKKTKPLLPTLIGDAVETIPLHRRTYNQDGLVSMHNTDFAREPDFAAAYAEAENANSWNNRHIQWRSHVICWAASQAACLEGDFVECGTNRGGTAMLMVRYVGKALESRNLYLYDTFCGLDSSVSSKDEIRRLGGHYTECYQQVVELFRSYRYVKVIQGTVPEVLHVNAPKRVAFLHIDLNAAAPERAALEFFWPRLMPGAFVVFDDYAWVAFVAQKLTIDEFALLHEVKVLTLPTGQGLLIKPAVP